MNKIWVVEIYEKGKWEPTTTGVLSREDARYEKRYWKRCNPDDRFRVWPYIPEEKAP